MIPADSLVIFLIASLLLGLAPGPDNIFVLMQSALYGRSAGLFVTLGLCTGLLIHTALVAVGVAAIVMASTLGFTVLKIVGVLYLLYLAWQAFFSSSINTANPVIRRISVKTLYWRGVVMNVTNPKVSIFFLAFLPQFTNPDNGLYTWQIAKLGFFFILITLFVFGVIAFLAGYLSVWWNRSPQAQRHLGRVGGYVFIGLAISLGISEVGI